MTTYIVPIGKTSSVPAISGSCGNYYEFDFMLSDDWNQLYNTENNDTHKLTGPSDLLGFNSLRLGLRRHKNKVNGLVAVAYSHIKGKTSYPALKDRNDKQLILYYLQEYKCRIFQDGSYWTIEIYSGGVLLTTHSDRMSINSFMRKLSQIYVEIEGKPSPYTLTTWLRIIRR